MLVEFGRFGRPHGVRGEVRFHPHNPDSPLLDDGRTIQIGDAAERTEAAEVEWVRIDAKGFVLKLRGVDDRDAAARLTHRRWFEPRDAFPAPADDEVYMADLIGLDACTPDGAKLGRVVDVVEIGPHDVLVIRGGGRRHLVPNVEAFVQRMDLERGQVIITPIDGLLDDGDGDA